MTPVVEAESFEWIVSQRPRTDVTLEDVAPDLAAAQANFMAVAYPGAVDLVTRGLLRILSGRLSHCSLCSNLRLRVAIDRGFDESMVGHLEDPANSDLPESRTDRVATGQRVPDRAHELQRRRPAAAGASLQS